MSSTSSSFTHLYGGTVSGALASVVVQPLDVLRTRQQQAFLKDLSTATNAVGKPIQRSSVSVPALARDIVSKEGLRALWSGTGPTLYRVIPGAGLYFYFLHMLGSPLRDEKNQLSPTSALLIGSFSRCVVTLLLAPVTVVKTRFEGSGTNPYRSTRHALSTIARTEGIRGLFSGATPTLLRDAPYSGIYFFCYESIKPAMKESLTFSPTILTHAVSAGIAGVIATLATHPQDVIKTRLQITPAAGDSKRGLLQVIAAIAKEGGMRGFYKGLAPRLIRRPLFAAISWALYEEIVK